MIYFSVGLPGAFSAWCAKALARLSERSAATIVAAAAGGAVDHAALVLVRNNAAHLVLSVSEPDDGLYDFLAETKAPFLLALDDPRVVVADFVAQGHTDMPALTRIAANLCPMLLRCRALPGALVLTADEVAHDGAAAIFRLASHFGMALTRNEAAAIFSELANEEVSRLANDLQGISSENRKMVDGALAPYAAAFNGASLGDIIWTRDLFLTVADPPGIPRQPINLRAAHNGRCLVFGPYVRLPAGTWTVKMLIGFSAEAVGQTIHLDIYNHSAGQLAVSKFVVRQRGVMAAELNFSLPDSGCDANEIRLMIGRESAPGQLALGHVILHPAILGPAGPLGNEFLAALDL